MLKRRESLKPGPPPSTQCLRALHYSTETLSIKTRLNHHKHIKLNTEKNVIVY